MTAPQGISFPSDQEGRRSSSALGRAVVADALRSVDAGGAAEAEAETDWRRRYLVHLRHLVVAGLDSAPAWHDIAAAGLESVHRRMTSVAASGEEEPLERLLTRPRAQELRTVEVRGDRPADHLLAVPHRGGLLRGDALRRQLAAWLQAGVLEPSAADAVVEVMAHPEWLALPGRTVAVLGAGAEMGPLAPLLRWGATVAAVDLPRPEVWGRVVRSARASAGRVLVPVRQADVRDDPPTDDAALVRAAGVDLLTDVPDVADWLLTLDGRLVLGNYLYADGGTHVRVAAAADVLASRLQHAAPDLALAFMATPTDVFAVPDEVVGHARSAYGQRAAVARLTGWPLRRVSRGALLHPAYATDADPAVCDALVPAQGPNYALAKRIQRWRASEARRQGLTVSFHVAPSSRTRSVTKHRGLAAAFAGAHRFGVEVFEPATANVLMAALLVHDLHVDPPARAHPWQDEAHAAVHGGLWRTAYAPRSVLGIAAVLGSATRRR